MSVLVILEFDSDEKAKEYVQHVFDTVVESKVRAVFKNPTRFCECVDYGKRHGGFSRGRKFGWWVHAQCGKPTRRWGNGDSWFSFLGTNLLPPELSTEYRPKGWERSEATWEFLLGENQVVPSDSTSVTTI